MNDLEVKALLEKLEKTKELSASNTLETVNELLIVSETIITKQSQIVSLSKSLYFNPFEINQSSDNRLVKDQIVILSHRYYSYYSIKANIEQVALDRIVKELNSSDGDQRISLLDQAIQKAIEIEQFYIKQCNIHSLPRSLSYPSKKQVALWNKTTAALTAWKNIYNDSKETEVSATTLASEYEKISITAAAWKEVERDSPENNERDLFWKAKAAEFEK